MAMEDVQDQAVGRILAEDIVTPNGRLILPQGTVLSGNHISYLKKWGISRINLERLPGPKEYGHGIRAMLEEAAEGLLSPMYACNDYQNPMVRATYHAGLGRMVERAVSGWNIPRKGVSLPVNDGRFQDLFFMGEFTLDDVISHEVELASFPDIYFKVNEAINSSKSDADYLARIISSDVSLCAKLLKLVNSPFYGLSTRVDSVSRAIALLGADELSTLALGISAISAFQDIPEELIDMKSFWTHSVAVGILARHLGGEIPGLSGERLFVGGLLHDMGRLVLFKKLPAASTEALIYSQTNLLPMVEAERDIFGFDHAMAGLMLARAWNLPEFLQDQIGGHHDSGDLTSLEAAITHLADFLAIGLVFADKGSLILPPLNDSALKLTGLTPEGLEKILPDVEREFNEIVGIFFG
ncbi:HDOD domain-containing protein [Desulfonatronovibrio hydrogenovorans]|uniref:HDOD domain-containing protein n=1 Tax=Desulfonatronovibrio hydrogenovorans TaxID=53245 RepID=UPI00048A841F|nr:HDOD domain-containing protein [Desulfonatronovibrio hydrogenovorans]